MSPGWQPPALGPVLVCSGTPQQPGLLDMLAARARGSDQLHWTGLRGHGLAFLATGDWVGGTGLSGRWQVRWLGSGIRQ